MRTGELGGPSISETLKTSAEGSRSGRPRVASLGRGMSVGGGRIQLSDLREAKAFMTEVRSMAGRGWDGWGWGCAKDICGAYLSFLSLFPNLNLTR